MPQLNNIVIGNVIEIKYDDPVNFMFTGRVIELFNDTHNNLIITLININDNIWKVGKSD